MFKYDQFTSKIKLRKNNGKYLIKYFQGWGFSSAAQIAAWQAQSYKFDLWYKKKFFYEKYFK